MPHRVQKMAKGIHDLRGKVEGVPKIDAEGVIRQIIGASHIEDPVERLKDMLPARDSLTVSAIEYSAGFAPLRKEASGLGHKLAVELIHEPKA